MTNLLVVLLSLAAGAAFGRRLDPAPLNFYVLHLALPALALTQVHHLPGLDLWGVASVWLVFVLAIPVFVGVGRLLRWDRATVGCLVLACGLSNTSFVGFPLLEALVGKEAIPAAVPLDQLGSFLLVCTLAPVVGAWFAGRSTSPRDLALRMVRFPALWAVIAALLLRDVPFPAALDGALERIGASMSPVALVAVGAQLRVPPRTEVGTVTVGLVYKLVLAPILVLVWMRGRDAQIPVLEAAMAPMVTGAILAQTYGLRPELASALLGVGVPLSLLTVWGWSHVV